MTEPDGILSAIASFSAATTAAFVGRLAWHTKQVQKRSRQFWSRYLYLEIVIAVFMGYVGAGLAIYLNLPEKAQPGFVAAISYLGPPVLEKFADTILTRKKGV